ncbi:MAG: hypothetical protein QOI11_3148 [Candidatus Eremiobacteraeota bacterium]|jgi:hypothetical protein|nr:hypothetical protein [Candidatus Eremiobacteraeota bacterium]
MNTLLSTAIAATLLATAASAPALAQPAPEAPIAVTSCAIDAAVRLYGEGPFQGAAGGDVAISFVNRAAVEATAVRFLVRTGRTVQTIDDRGSFASGTRIDRIFSPATASYDGGSAACEVESVSFADGTTWQR